MAGLDPEFVISEEQQPLVATATELQAAIAELIRRNAQLSAQMQRTSRHERRQREKFYVSVLRVADAFDRILAPTGVDELDELLQNRLASVRTAAALLQQVLTQEDIMPLEIAAGDPYDSAFAEAAEVQVRSDCPDRTILAIIERGYRWEEKLLRPARVVVSKQA